MKIVQRVVSLTLAVFGLGILGLAPFMAQAETLANVSSEEGGYYTLTEAKTFKNVSIPYIKSIAADAVSSFGANKTTERTLSERCNVTDDKQGIYYWEQTVNEITCQLQWKDSTYLFGFQIKFVQSGSDVLASIVQHHYYMGNEYGVDARTQGRGGKFFSEYIPDSDTDIALALKDIRLVVSDETQIEMDAQWDGAGSGVSAGDTLVWNGGAEGVWDGTSENWLATDGTAIRWVKGCVAKFTAPAIVTIDGKKDLAGIVSCAGEVTLKGSDIIFADQATIVYSGDTRVRLENHVLGNNGLTTLLRLGDQQHTLSGNLTTEFRKVATGVSIDTVSGLKMTIYNRFGGYLANSRTISNVVPEGGTGDGIYHWQYDPEQKLITAQFWWNNEYKQAVVLELKETDGDLYARIVKAYYLYNGKWGDDCTKIQDFGNNFHDTDDKVDAVATTSTSCKELAITAGSVPTTYGLELAGDYSVKGVTRIENGTVALVDEGTMGSGKFSSELQLCDAFMISSSTPTEFAGKITAEGTGLVKTLPGSAVKFSSNNGTSWSLLVAGRTEATGYSTLPHNHGFIEVAAGGRLVIEDMYEEWGPNGGELPIVIDAGGVVECARDNSIGVWKHIYNSGVVETGAGLSQILYRFHLCDGGRITGETVRAGYNAYYGKWSFVEATGSKASAIEVENLVIYGENASVAAPSGLQLIVDDVTCDAASDLVVSSKITEKDSDKIVERAGTGLWKQGEGTVEFSGAESACPNGIFRLEAGTVRFAATASGTYGALELTGDASIEIVDGAKVAFAEDAGIAWETDATLNITGKLRKGALHVGALTAAQLAQITYEGKRGKVYVDDTGCLRANTALVLSIR